MSELNVTPSRESTFIAERRALALISLAAVVLSASCLGAADWPSTVNEAVALVEAEMSDEDGRELAYLGEEELVGLHFGWGMAMRNAFGMWAGNERLLQDCAPDDHHPDTCSGVIIQKIWERQRAKLPAKERLALEQLESRMDRITVPVFAFKQTRLEDVVAVFTDVIHTQLPEADHFAVRYDPAYADELINWSEEKPTPFREAMARLAANTHVLLKKTPPDLLLEPDLIPISADDSADGNLNVLYSSQEGPYDESTKVLISDEDQWTKLWDRITSEDGSNTPRPAIDFTRNSLLLIALGRRPHGGYELAVEPLGIRDQVVTVAVSEVKPGKSCVVTTRVTHPFAIFIVPAPAKSARYLEALTPTEKDCGA